MFFERLESRVGAVAAGESVVGEERHQFAELQRDARLVVKQQAAAALQLHDVQVTTLPAATEQTREAHVKRHASNGENGENAFIATFVQFVRLIALSSPEFLSGAWLN